MTAPVQWHFVEGGVVKNASCHLQSDANYSALTLIAITKFWIMLHNIVGHMHAYLHHTNVPIGAANWPFLSPKCKWTQKRAPVSVLPEITSFSALRPLVSSDWSINFSHLSSRNIHLMTNPVYLLQVLYNNLISSKLLTKILFIFAFWILRSLCTGMLEMKMDAERGAERWCCYHLFMSVLRVSDSLGKTQIDRR